VTSATTALGKHGEGIPLVSTVLITFNRVNVLEHTLRSVLIQTLNEFELIVCNDASTDGIPVVMTEWAARDPRILCVRQPRNLKTARSLCYGIALAKAEMVAVLHNSDFRDPRLLEQCVAALQGCGRLQRRQPVGRNSHPGQAMAAGLAF
jgi:glycosyltransferase involved in cell wall biosynthesis